MVGEETALAGGQGLGARVTLGLGLSLGQARPGNSGRSPPQNPLYSSLLPSTLR